MVVFMFPETKWHRPHPDEVLKNAAADGKQSPPLTSEKKVDHKADSVEDPATIEGAADIDLSHQSTADRDPWLGRGKPSKQQWKIFQPNKNFFGTIVMDLWIPWKLFAFSDRRVHCFRCLLELQFLLDDQSYTSSKLCSPAIQLQLANDRLHELCHIGWRSYWSCNQWLSLRLGQCKSNTEESRYPRTGNASASFDPICAHHDAWKLCCGIRLPAKVSGPLPPLHPFLHRCND